MMQVIELHCSQLLTLLNSTALEFTVPHFVSYLISIRADLKTLMFQLA